MAAAGILTDRSDAIICYAETDTNIAVKITSSLKKKGYNVFMIRELEDKSKAKLEEKVANTSVVLFCASRALARDPVCKNAADLAMSKRKRTLILSTKKDEEIPSGFLDVLQGFNEPVDLSEYGIAIEEIVAFLQKYVQKPYDAMICYARKDTQIGQRIAQKLREADTGGRKLQIYDPRTASGTELSNITYGLDHSGAVLLCVSGSIQDSALCEKVAAQLYRKELPVRLLKVKDDSSSNKHFFKGGVRYDFSKDELFAASLKKLIHDIPKKDDSAETDEALGMFARLYLDDD